MIRTCDGTDQNLTRTVPIEQYDPGTMTISMWDAATKSPRYRVINCQCGRVFNDEDYLTCYPHNKILKRIGLIQ